MASVKVICDSNFTKTEDVDKSVGKVLKMFSKHLEKKTAPLSKSSDMECVYLYTKLSPDKVRLMKKMLNSNKTLLHFKELVISKPGSDKSMKYSDNDSDKSCSEKSCSEKSCSEKSCSEKSCSEKSCSEKSCSEKSCSDKSCSEKSCSEKSCSVDLSSCDSESPLSKKVTKNRYQEISEQLRELADEIETFSHN